MVSAKVVFWLMLPVVAFGAGIGFPGKQSCVSPDLKWIVRCQSEVESNGSGLHRIMLSRLGGQEEAFVYASGRSCDILWSEDGARFAITDWLGSSLSDIYLVEVSPKIVSRLEVPDVSRFLLKAEWEGHIYWEAMKWETPHQLLIRVFGHTDEANGHGFTYFFSVDINSQAAVLKRKTAEERSEWLEGPGKR